MHEERTFLPEVKEFLSGVTENCINSSMFWKSLIPRTFTFIVAEAEYEVVVMPTINYEKARVILEVRLNHGSKFHTPFQLRNTFLSSVVFEMRADYSIPEVNYCNSDNSWASHYSLSDDADKKFSNELINYSLISNVVSSQFGLSLLGASKNIAAGVEKNYKVLMPEFYRNLKCTEAVNEILHSQQPITQSAASKILDFI